MPKVEVPLRIVENATPEHLKELLINKFLINGLDPNQPYTMVEDHDRHVVTYEQDDPGPEPAQAEGDVPAQPE